MERKHCSSSSSSSNNNNNNFFSFNKTSTIAAESKKKQKKVPFTEENAASLLDKYDASTVLTLLQEVASHPNWKMNWKELVEKTSTGISSAKEYQMLWRHLAYGHPLIHQEFEDGAPPLDDDSDLECEREASPAVTKQTESLAAACVQVMIASVSLSQSTPTSSVIEAPLTINVPVCGSSSRAPSGSSQQPSNLMEETDIIFPVTVQRQMRLNVSSSSTTTRAIKTNNIGSVSGIQNNNKRKAWSAEEDMQLQAAVQRWGEGNWADMAARDGFHIQRSPSQLSKRWNTLRKKGGGVN